MSQRHKKPTMKQLKTAIENILMHMSTMQKQLNQADSIIGSYIEYKGDKDDFTKWLQKKIEEVKSNDNSQKDTGQSSKGDRKVS